MRCTMYNTLPETCPPRPAQDAFTDIVLGSNKVGRGGQPLPYGFNCSKGWDPATGLGTPLFQKLLKAALA